MLKEEGDQTVQVARTSEINADTIQERLNFLQRLGLAPTIKGTLKRIDQLTKKITGLSNQSYRPWKVLIIICLSLDTTRFM